MGAAWCEVGSGVPEKESDTLKGKWTEFDGRQDVGRRRRGGLTEKPSSVRTEPKTIAGRAGLKEENQKLYLIFQNLE